MVAAGRRTLGAREPLYLPPAQLLAISIGYLLALSSRRS
jgi:hypothetical protein